MSSKICFIYQVCVTLWGKQAEDFDGSNNAILAIKGARIGEFNGGKNLSLLVSSVLEKDPDLPEAHRYVININLLRISLRSSICSWCVCTYIAYISDCADGTPQSAIRRTQNRCPDRVALVVT